MPLEESAGFRVNSDRLAWSDSVLLLENTSVLSCLFLDAESVMEILIDLSLVSVC